MGNLRQRRKHTFGLKPRGTRYESILNSSGLQAVHSFAPDFGEDDGGEEEGDGESRP